VLPEGIPDECHLLFGFSLECARSNPDIEFLWRLHPILKYETLVAQNPALGNLPSNVRLSTGSLEEDISCSGWVLYRGTTAVVQAVVAGLRPLYLQSPGELTIDPLYELQVWRTSVSTVSELYRTIRSDRQRLPAENQRDSSIAGEYCKQFYSPIDPAALETAILS